MWWLAELSAWLVSNKPSKSSKYVIRLLPKWKANPNPWQHESTRELPGERTHNTHKDGLSFCQISVICKEKPQCLCYKMKEYRGGSVISIYDLFAFLSCGGLFGVQDTVGPRKTLKALHMMQQPCEKDFLLCLVQKDADVIWSFRLS